VFKTTSTTQNTETHIYCNYDNVTDTMLFSIHNKVYFFLSQGFVLSQGYYKDTNNMT